MQATEGKRRQMCCLQGSKAQKMTLRAARSALVLCHRRPSIALSVGPAWTHLVAVQALSLGHPTPAVHECRRVGRLKNTARVATVRCTRLSTIDMARPLSKRTWQCTVSLLGITNFRRIPLLTTKSPL